MMRALVTSTSMAGGGAGWLQAATAHDDASAVAREDGTNRHGHAEDSFDGRTTGSARGWRPRERESTAAPARWPAPRPAVARRRWRPVRRWRPSCAPAGRPPVPRRRGREGAHRGGARERHDVDAALQQLSVDVELGVVVHRQRAERRRLRHVGPGGGQRLAERVTSAHRRRHQHARAGDGGPAAKRLDDAVDGLTFERQVDADAEARQPFGRADAHRAQARTRQRPGVAAALHEAMKERFHAVHGREEHPGEAGNGVGRGIERVERFERRHAQHRGFDGFGAGALRAAPRVRRPDAASG